MKRFLLFVAVLLLAPLLATPAEAAPMHSSGVVRVERTLANGSLLVGTFTPAPGVDATQLARKLGGKVVTQTRVPWKRQQRADVCYYGTARQTCPEISYWRNRGNPDPVVWVADYTDADRWDVDQSVADAQSLENIDIRYARGWCPANPAAGERCLTVESADVGPTGWSAAVWMSYEKGEGQCCGAFLEPWLGGTARATFNDYPGYGLWGQQRRGIGCHEVIGHMATGLQHSTPGAPSCMDHSALYGTLGYDAEQLVRINYSVPR